MSLDICLYPRNHHHQQGNMHITKNFLFLFFFVARTLNMKFTGDAHFAGLKVGKEMFCFLTEPRTFVTCLHFWQRGKMVITGSAGLGKQLIMSCAYRNDACLSWEQRAGQWHPECPAETVTPERSEVTLPRVRGETLPSGSPGPCPAPCPLELPMSPRMKSIPKEWSLLIQVCRDPNRLPPLLPREDVGVAGRRAALRGALTAPY